MVTTRRQEHESQSKLYQRSSPHGSYTNNKSDGTIGTANASEVLQGCDGETNAIHYYQKTPVKQQQHVSNLKSALKAPRVLGDTEADDLARLQAADATPLGDGVKKRVRIYSGNNIVHFFGGSSTDSRFAVAGGEVDWEAGSTPDSGVRRKKSSTLPGANYLFNYQTFIQSIQDDASARNASQAGAEQHRVRQNNASSWLCWRAAAVILSWMVVSSALIFVNKTILVDQSFPYPFALTAIGSAASTALGLAAGALGLAEVRPHPSAWETLTKLLPVAFCTAATLFLGNSAYLDLSVAFINIMKALTPAITLGISLLLGLERPSVLVAGALALIALGTGIATAQEAATSHFSWFGFGCFLLSILFEALRVVLVERLLGRQRFNSIEVLVYIGPLTLFCLLLGSFFFERSELLSKGPQIITRNPLLFLAAGVVSFLVNAFSFLAIQTSSSLTFKVAGCVKNAVVVWIGVVQGDNLTIKEAAGYVLSLVGFLVYTVLRAALPHHAKQS